MTLPPIKIGDHPCSPSMIWGELEIAWITEYAQAAVLAEREVIAQMFDTMSSDNMDAGYMAAWARSSAAAIRARDSLPAHTHG